MSAGRRRSWLCLTARIGDYTYDVSMHGLSRPQLSRTWIDRPFTDLFMVRVGLYAHGVLGQHFSLELSTPTPERFLPVEWWHPKREPVN